MTNNSSKNSPVSPLLDITPGRREPNAHGAAFDVAPEVILTDAGPSFRPHLYRAFVLDHHSSLIRARRFGS